MIPAVPELSASIRFPNTASLWEGTDNWSVDAGVLDDWIATAAAGLAYATASACSVIDFSAVVVDGWLPVDIRRRLVDAVGEELDKLNMTGLEKPEIRSGTVGADARALGAASLPLFARFLLNQK